MSDLEEKQKEIEEKQKKIAEKQKEIEEKQKEIAEKRKEIDRIKETNARMIAFIRAVQWGGKAESERFLKSIEA